METEGEGGLEIGDKKEGRRKEEGREKEGVHRRRLLMRAENVVRNTCKKKSISVYFLH